MISLRWPSRISVKRAVRELSGDQSPLIPYRFWQAIFLLLLSLAAGVDGFLYSAQTNQLVMAPHQQQPPLPQLEEGEPSTKRRKISAATRTSLEDVAKLPPFPPKRFSSRLRAAAAASTMASTTTTAPSSPRRFTFGVMADIQYAPIPDGFSYAGVPRYYRHSLEVADHAARHFQEEQVPLVVNLGDIIDGKCQDGLQAIDDVIRALSAYTSGPILHTYGNHELYNLDRPTLESKLGIPFVQEPCGDLVGYRSHVHDGIRFVVLDTYDIAKLQRCPNTSCKYREACDILQRSNPNYPHAENSPSGMNGLARRFVAFNGAVGPIQLEWLRETLTAARAADEKAILLSHQPILPGSSSPVCLVWNYQDVLDVLRDFGDVVIASLAGHAHKGGYKRDPQSGIHFRVIEAVLENPAPHKTYGLIDVHDDCLVIRGCGNCTSSVYDLGHCKDQRTSYNEEVALDRNISAVAVK